MKLTIRQRLAGYIPDPPAPSLPPTGSWNGYTLRDWQGSTEHIAYARELFQQPKFRDLLAVLSNSRPRPLVRGVNETEAAIMLGVREGYDQLLGLVLQLPVFPPMPSEEVTADYGASEFDVNRT